LAVMVLADCEHPEGKLIFFLHGSQHLQLYLAYTRILINVH
jgi:hypothetical protein